MTVGAAVPAVGGDEPVDGDPNGSPVVYEQTVTNDGGVTSLGIPGPTSMTVDEMLPEDMSGLEIWEYSEEEWQRVTDLDRELEAFDAFVISTSQDTGPDQYDIRIELESDESASPQSVDAGWNHVPARSFSTPAESFQTASTDPDLILDTLDPLTSPNYRTIDPFNWYSFHHGDPPELDPFKGYFVHFSEDGELEPRLANIQGVADAADQLDHLEEVTGTVQSDCDVSVPSWNEVKRGTGEEYDIQVTHPSYANTTVFDVERGEERPTVVRLDRQTSSLSVVVEDRAGDSLGAASVTLVSDTDSPTNSTNASGETTLSSIPVGPQELVVEADGYESKRVNVTVHADETSTNVSLEEGSEQISGTVVDSADTAVEGALVSSGSHATLSDTGGEFTLETTAEPSTLTVTHADYETTTANVTDSMKITLDTDQARLEGTVLDPAGEPLANTTVTLYGTEYRDDTDATGEFATGPIGAGEYGLALDHPDHALEAQAVEIEEGQVANVTATVGSEPADYSGLVVHADTGTPIENASVELVSRTAGTSNPDGLFTFEEVPVHHMKDYMEDRLMISMDDYREDFELTYEDGCVQASSSNWFESRAEIDERMTEREEHQQEHGADGAADDLEFEDVTTDTGIEYTHEPIPPIVGQFDGMMNFHYGGVATADVTNNGYQDLYFVDAAGHNELWVNQGNGTFEDYTEQAGVGVPEDISTSAAFADVTNDGNQDLYVTTFNGQNYLFENQGNGTFDDVSEASNTDYRGYSSSGMFLDYTDNGHLDLFVVNMAHIAAGMEYGFGDRDDPYMFDPDHGEPNVLYENQGDGTFERQETNLSRSDSWDQEAAIVPDSGSTPDLYVMDIDGPDALYESGEDGTFEDATEEHFDQVPYSSFGGTVFDSTNDGEFELYVTEKHSEVYTYDTYLPNLSEQRSMIEEFDRVETDELLHGSAHFRPTEEGYTEVSEDVGTQTFLPWGAASADVSASGHTDLYVPSGMEYIWYEPDALLLNDGSGSFDRAEFLTSIHPREDRFHSWHPVDCADPAEPNFCSLEETEELAATEFEGHIDVQNQRSSRAALPVDLDGDGALDLVLTQHGSEPRILENQLQNTTSRNHLKIDLVGSEAPKDGIGAVVTVSTEDGEEQHVFADGRTYFGQNQQPLYVGLGTAEPATVTVEWPTGDVDEYTVQEVNETIELHQDGSAVKTG